MMARVRLEVFETDQPAPGETIVTDLNAMEEAKLAAYEQGYTAGWEDAATAQSDEQGRMRADIARNMQALGFTYQEARAHVLAAVEPLIRDLVGHVLPQIARRALAPMIVDMLMPVAREAADAPASLSFNPVNRGLIDSVIGQTDGLPLTLIEEPTLGEGQVYLRLQGRETRIDLDTTLLRIGEATDEFFTLSRQEAPHG